MNNNCICGYMCNSLPFNNLYEVSNHFAINFLFASYFNTSILSDSVKWIKLKFEVIQLFFLFERENRKKFMKKFDFG